MHLRTMLGDAGPTNNAYSNILSVRSVVSFVLQNGFAKWRSSKQRKLSKMARINGHMMKSKIWLNCLKRNPVRGIFFRTITQRGRWKKELMLNWRYDTSNKWSHYNVITFSKCWSNMLDTLTQMSPSCWPNI